MSVKFYNLKLNLFYVFGETLSLAMLNLHDYANFTASHPYRLNTGLLSADYRFYVSRIYQPSMKIIRCVPSPSRLHFTVKRCHAYDRTMGEDMGFFWGGTKAIIFSLLGKWQKEISKSCGFRRKEQEGVTTVRFLLFSQ